MTFVPAAQGVEKIETTLTGATVAAAGAVLSANFGPMAALPANARVVAVEYQINTSFTVGGGGTFLRLGLFENGVDPAAATALIYDGSLLATAGKFGAVDSNNVSTPQRGYATRGGQALDIKVTSDVNLSNVGAGGSVTVRVFYSVVL